MKKISELAAKAFVQGRRFTSGNTKVNSEGLFLHGNKIAWKHPDVKDWVVISFCGWPTTTTKDRLNALTQELGIKHTVFHTKNYVLHAEGLPINPSDEYYFNTKDNKKRFMDI